MKQFKYVVTLFNLLYYLKNNNIKFYTLYDTNINLLYKKVNFCLLDKNIPIVFIFNKMSLIQNQKVYFVNFLNFDFIKIFLYFLTI